MSRRTSQALFEALMLDSWPSAGALVDFGLDGPQKEAARRYSVLQALIRRGEITLPDLDAASCDGPALTRLVNRCTGNPCPGIEFRTCYDPLLNSADHAMNYRFLEDAHDPDNDTLIMGDTHDP